MTCVSPETRPTIGTVCQQLENMQLMPRIFESMQGGDFWGSIRHMRSSLDKAKSRKDNCNVQAAQIGLGQAACVNQGIGSANCDLYISNLRETPSEKHEWMLLELLHRWNIKKT